MESASGPHRLVFNEVAHTYKLDDRLVPGPTTFIKWGLATPPALVNWQLTRAAEFAAWEGAELGACVEAPKKEQVDLIVKRAKIIPFELAKKAARTGSVVHAVAYLLEQDREKEADAILDGCVAREDFKQIIAGTDRFKLWHAVNYAKVIKAEEICASVKHQYGGKFDRLAERKGKLILSDFKTSKAIYPEFFLQLAAYRMAVEEWFGLTVDVLEILRFGKDGSFSSEQVDSKSIFRLLNKQVIRCRETYEFQRDWTKNVSSRTEKTT